MLEELFNLVKGAAQDHVVNNPDIPSEHNDEVIAEATDTVASGFRNIVAGGGLQSLLSLFNTQQAGSSSGTGSNLMSNPIVSMMIGHFASKLMNKFNLGSTQANSVATGLIPSVISNLVNKTNDSGQSGFSLENLINSITGGQLSNIAQSGQGGSGLDIGSLLKQFTGGDGATSQGGGGLMDIVSQLAGGAQAQQQQNGGGGLMDLIKGFMK